MKKFPLIFLLCITVTAFIFKTEIINSLPPITATWASLPSLPYTLSHNVTVAADTGGTRILIIGGIAGDSVSSRVLLYNTASALYDTTIPKLPKKLMNGFGFKLKDSVYYGGGYGPNWSDTSLSAADTLYDCFFSSSGIRYISGQKGKVYYSGNAGLSWTPRLLPDTSKNVVGISFVTDSTGWAVTNRGDTTGIYSTSNRGVSWIARAGGSYNDIFFTDVSNGWVCGNNGSIRRTTNGGVTWSSQSFGADNYKSIFFISSSTGYICGAGGKVIKTTNGGTNWSAQTSGTTKTLNSIIFQDSTGYAVGDNGTIIKTINGGALWTAQTTNTILNFRSADNIDKNKIIVSGDRGIIIYTVNGGTNWIQRAGVSSNRLNRVGIAKGDSIPTAVGVRGHVTKANKPFFEYFINDTFYKINVNNLSAGWQTKAALPIAIAEVYSSSVTVNDRIAFVIGGRSSGYNYVDSVLRYNPLTDSWSFATRLPKKLSETGAASISANKIMVIGGKNQNEINSRVYIATVDTNNPGGFGVSWGARDSTLPDNPVPLYAMGSKGFPRKRVAFFIGGNTTLFSFADNSLAPSTRVYMYDDRQSAFSELVLDVANPICHTGVDGCESIIPFESSSASDTSVRIFAPGGRDSNYIAVNRNKVLKVNGLVSIRQISAEVPAGFTLGQNYPNPFNPATKIQYELPFSSDVEFKVFDVTGKEIFSNILKFQSAGKYEITFDGKLLSSGIYFYRLNTGKFSETRKMLLLK